MLRPPARVVSGKALLKIPTMPSEGYAAISPAACASGPSGGWESKALLRDGALRLEAWGASSTGREHARLGTVRAIPHPFPSPRAYRATPSLGLECSQML